jgi:hypothetical protein
MRPALPTALHAQPVRAVLLFALCFAWLLHRHGPRAAAGTLALALLVYLLNRLLPWLMHRWLQKWLPARIHRRIPMLRRGLALALFFLTPILTLHGDIGVLTGFGGSSASLPWLGISFVSAALALHVARAELNFSTLLGILQPARFNSGPCALPGGPGGRVGTGLSWRRVRLYCGWLVLGAFFYSVFAAGIAPLLVLKQSSDALDILTFAILFEAYVYFNFCGISFMVYGLLRLAGLPVIRNFNTPFAARDVIGYWQRWHISLSCILKGLFFQPVKARFGLSLAVVSVFLCSAMWHGMSFNFVLWGAFHAVGWLLTRAIGLHRHWGRILNALLFPVVIVLGRLIFSEADTSTLLFKLRQLLHFASDGDAWLVHMTLDGKTCAILAGALLWLLAEAILPRRHGNYRLLRRKWMPLVLLGLCLAFGNSGLGSVYGAR